MAELLGRALWSMGERTLARSGTKARLADRMSTATGRTTTGHDGLGQADREGLASAPREGLRIAQ
jgi:hypothetical protein